MKRFIGTIVVGVLALSGCEIGPPPTDVDQTATASPERLPDDEAGETIRRSIDFAAGTWDDWAAVQSVRYRKTTINVDEGGYETRRIVQLHEYDLKPFARMRISWQENGSQYVLVNDGDEARKYVDGRPATAPEDRDEAWNSTFGSHYVFCMPFKLTDSGAMPSHLGIVSLPDIGDAIAVQVDYREWAGSAGGMHTWTYFFSPKDYRLVANHLKYGPDDYSYTEYADYRVVDGVHMPTRRYGYRSDADFARFERTSEIFYDSIQYDVILADSLFEL